MNKTARRSQKSNLTSKSNKDTTGKQSRHMRMDNRLSDKEEDRTGELITTEQRTGEINQGQVKDNLGRQSQRGK